MEVGSSSLPGTTHRQKAMCTRRKSLGLHRSRKTGGLAQLARAPALQAGGQRFESVILHYSGEFEGKGNHIFHLSSLIWNEIFDILTHKTVSKDL